MIKLTPELEEIKYSVSKCFKTVESRFKMLKRIFLYEQKKPLNFARLTDKEQKKILEDYIKLTVFYSN